MGSSADRRTRLLVRLVPVIFTYYFISLWYGSTQTRKDVRSLPVIRHVKTFWRHIWRHFSWRRDIVVCLGIHYMCMQSKAKCFYVVARSVSRRLKSVFQLLQVSSASWKGTRTFTDGTTAWSYDRWRALKIPKRAGKFTGIDTLWPKWVTIHS